ncbi:MAG: TolC family protein [Desulfobacteraceae bacterium]|nr:MAG: TolC family protein [Desulfobacteraceae bacterium]
MSRFQKKNFVHILFGIVFILFISNVSTAQTQDNIYTLDKSIAEALANSWTIKAKKEKIEQAKYSKKQAGADFYPTLSTTYGYTRLSEVKKSQPQDYTITFPAPFGSGSISIPGQDLNSQDNYQWKVSVKQSLFTGFALTSSYELAKLGIDQSQIDLDLTELDLALEVKAGYFNILKTDRAVEVSGKAVESLSSHLEVAQSFYKVGMSAVNDVLKAEVELANAQHDLIKAQNGAKIARAAFNNLLARPIDAPLAVEDILSYHQIESDFSSNLKKAMDQRPEIKTLDINLRQVEKQIKIAKSKYYPEVYASYDYIKEGDHPNVTGSAFHDGNSWQAMVGLSWILWDWGKTSNSVLEKESLKKELSVTRSKAVDGLNLNIKQAMLDLEAADKNMVPTQKAVEQAEENLRVSQERYKAQVTTSTEVLDAQTLLNQARMNYYNALYDHILAKAKLQRAIGER